MIVKMNQIQNPISPNDPLSSNLQQAIVDPKNEQSELSFKKTLDQSLASSEIDPNAMNAGKAAKSIKNQEELLSETSKKKSSSAELLGADAQAQAALAAQISIAPQVPVGASPVVEQGENTQDLIQKKPVTELQLKKSKEASGLANLELQSQVQKLSGPSAENNESRSIDLKNEQKQIASKQEVQKQGDHKLVATTTASNPLSSIENLNLQQLNLSSNAVPLNSKKMPGITATLSHESTEGLAEELMPFEMGVGPGTQSIKARPSHQKTIQTLQGDDYLSMMKAVRSEPQTGTMTMAQQMKDFSGALNGEKAPSSALKLVKAQGPSFEGTKDEYSSIQSLNLASLGQTSIAKESHLGTLPQLTAQVTQGANAQDRLTSESLISMSTGIRNFSLNGGGEMRIRLKPNDLGEVSLRVITDGSRVDLKIQASSEKSKQIIEESIQSLRESLSNQNLTLSQVDLSVVGGSHAKSEGNESNQSFQQFTQNPLDFSDSNARDGQNQRSNHEVFDSESQDPSRRTLRRAAVSSASLTGLDNGHLRSTRNLDQGRIDVRI